MATSAAPPPPAPSGVLIAGRYLLDRRIGRGGMAEVWSATDTELDRRVAVKWLKSNLATDQVVAERFRREAIAVARLSHPNIVAVHDVCEHEGRQAVVMQLVDGKSLRMLLDTQKRLGPELTIHIGAAIAGALHEAHKSGFVHRDVKPGNILVTSDGRVLLTDFGIAKGLDPQEDDLTSDNVMMGTAKYLSPEQVRGHRLDGRADLYSLGLVLYECLAGRVPFLGESDADTALARLQRDPTDLGHLRPTLPIGLVNLIHRTLARNPAHRPQSGNDLRAALLAVDTSPPEIDGTPAEPPPRIANPPTRARGAGPGRPGSPASPVGPVGIPGEPHVSGVLPVTRPAAPGPGRAPRRRPTVADLSPPSGVEQRAGEHTPSHLDGRDDTPAATGPIRATPARRDAQRATPARVVVGVLLAIAAIAAVTLFVVATRGDAPTGLPATTVVPGETVPLDAALTPTEAADDGTAAVPAAGGVAAIAGAHAWDPDGDNGTENDAQAGRAIDGNRDTTWATECYQDKYLGGKRGVGLVVALAAPATGSLSVEVASGPYQLDVYATTEATAPTDLAAWQPVGDTAFADSPGTVTRPVGVAATHLLVWLKELGEDAACSSSNPFRGQLAEIAFTG